MLTFRPSLPSRYLLVKSQEWKHQDNVWNLFKISNKDFRDVVLVSLLLTLNGFHTLFWYFHCRLRTSKYRQGIIILIFLLLTSHVVLINPCHATGLFLHPLKASENQMFFDVFRGYRKRPVALNGLIVIVIFQKIMQLTKSQHLEIFEDNCHIMIFLENLAMLV